LAVASTGEYAARFGGTVADAMRAVVTTVNRVSGIYEREAAIRLLLVDGNDRLLFTNALTDPFNNEDATILINQSQSEIDRIIGDSNYDIGHTLSTGAGGLAGLGVVGVTGQKARGVTGRSAPFGDPFDVDYVSHEMGHQFGGDHTFNGKLNSCSGGNRNRATAFEPGSGSTIQAYAGICSSDDLQPNSDPYFHSISLDQIITYSTSAGNQPAPTVTGNNSPIVDAGANHVIPVQTPFTLTAIGSDVDGDALTFAWEQRDIGPAARLNKLDDGQIPLFRSFNPTTNPSRTFPKWPNILNQTSTLGEQLPRLPRRMDFRVTVRDNRSGGGGTNGDDMILQVVDTAGPFTVTFPNTQSVHFDLLKVTWDVANTDKSPVDTQFVNILLSTDGGRNFSTTLASATANDGEEIIALPAEANSNLRVMVAAVDNVFFAVSPKNFNVEGYQAEVFVVRHAEKGLGSDPELTDAGTRRAAFLARLLSVGRIDAVYSTSFRRTMQTAGPTADAAGVSITKYSTDPSDLISELKSLDGGKRVLVVGHSNTVGLILNGLGVSQSIHIEEDEFDNLFVATLTDSGIQSQRLRFLSHQPVPVNAGRLIAPMTGRHPSIDSGDDATLRILEEKLDLILEKLSED